ncbi:MAG: hypothetical protein JNM07_06085 [Phycisphaerae bacterium]|nr:hypothetical protein [Phycisphaerae bacterium]
MAKTPKPIGGPGKSPSIPPRPAIRASDRLGPARARVGPNTFPERRSGANLPPSLGMERPDTTSSPRGSGSRRGPVDRRRGSGDTGGGGGGNRIKGGDVASESSGGMGGMN